MVGHATKRKFLGYTMYRRKEKVHLKVAPAVLARFKGDLKQVFRRGQGHSLVRIIEALNPKLRGWMAYFRHIGVKGILGSWIAGYAATYVRYCGFNGSGPTRAQGT